MKTLLILSSLLFSSFCYADSVWVPAQVQNNVMPIVPQVVSSQVLISPPRPVWTIKLVPNVVMKPMVVERQRLFFREQTVQMVPTLEWTQELCLVYVWP